MNRYTKLIFTLATSIYFTGCGVANKTLKTEYVEDTSNLTLEPIKEPEKKKVKIVKKATSSKAKKKSSKPVVKKAIEKPKEVERVCFDKQGTAHNCNYKIPKPYNNEISKRELYTQ